MVHKHEYETLHVLELEPSARQLGIKRAETRKCAHCGSEKVFVLLGDAWLPLFKWSSTQRVEL